MEQRAEYIAGCAPALCSRLVARVFLACSCVFCVRPAAHLSLSSIASATGYTISASGASDSAHGSAQVTSSSGTASPYPSGTSITITLTPNTGYTCTSTSLKVNGSTVNLTQNGNSWSYTFNITQNTTYEYTFTPKNYTINTAVAGSVGGSVSVSPAGTSHAYDSTVTFTANEASGYHFVSWSISGSGSLSSTTNKTTTLKVSGNATVTATFAINTYTITATANGNGTVSANPTGTSYNHGTQITLTAQPNEHYEVDYWTQSINGAGATTIQQGGNTLSVTATNNATYNVYFKIKQYSLTIASGNTEYGTIREASTGATGGISGTFDALTTYSYIAIANDGYTFKFWQDSTGAVVTTSNLLDVTLTQDSTYTAVFVRASIAVYAVGGGEVRMNGYLPDEIEQTDTIHLSAFAYAGYEFTGWTCEDGTDISAYTVNSGTGEPYLSVDLPFSIIQGKIIIANFVPINNGNINDDLNN